jgi:quercetin dioxygenase-like cupin family protein
VSSSVAAGRVIDNPISGERIVIQTTAAQSGGQLLSFDLFLPPNGRVPARHVHPAQTEQFTVVEGRIRFRLGRRTILVSPGETVRVPPGTAHWFGNTGATVARMHVEVRPALRMEELLVRAGGMGIERRIPGVRIPRLTDLAGVLLEFQHEIAVPSVPAFVVRAVLTPLAWLGRRRTAS